MNFAIRNWGIIRKKKSNYQLELSWNLILEVEKERDTSPGNVTDFQSDLEALVCGVSHVLKPEFIAAHLTDDPAPDPANFTPVDVEKIQAR